MRVSVPPASAKVSRPNPPVTRSLPDAAVEHVVERGADEAVVVRLALQGHGDPVRGRDAVGSECGGVEGVVARPCADREGVSLGAHGLADEDGVGPAGTGAHDLDVRAVAAGARDVGEHEGVRGCGAVDGDRVAGEVGSDGRVGDLAAEGHAVDDHRFGAGAGGGHPPTEVDRQLAEARVRAEVVHDDGVGAGATVDEQGLDAGCRAVRSVERQGERPGGLAGDGQRVGRRGEGEDQRVGAAAAVHRDGGVVGPVDGDDEQVVVVAAEELRGQPFELVVPGAPGEHVGEGGADEQVVAGVAVDRRGTGALVDEHVVAAAALDEHVGRATGGDEVVVTAAAQLHVGRGAGAGSRVDALVGDDVVVGAAVDGHWDEHVVLDDDRVHAVAEVRDDRADVLVGVAAAEGGDLDRRGRGCAADLLDDDRLVGVGDADVARGALCRAADVDVQDAVGVAPVAQGAAVVARQVGRRRELEVADGEAGGLGDVEAQDRDGDLDPQLDLDAPVGSCGGGVDAEAEARGRRRRG